MKQIVVTEICGQRKHIKYLNELNSPARNLRRNWTQSEDIIWNRVLRGKQTGYKFTRQKPLLRFIADFYCSQLALILEIDGGYHNIQPEYDKARDDYLERCGIITIRYKNDDVLNRIEWVKIDLKEKLELRLKELK